MARDAPTHVRGIDRLVGNTHLPDVTVASGTGDPCASVRLMPELDHCTRGNVVYPSP